MKKGKHICRYGYRVGERKFKVKLIQDKAQRAVQNEQEIARTRKGLKKQEEEVAVYAIPLATKPPTIVDWEIHKEGKKIYYQIIRADGSSKDGGSAGALRNQENRNREITRRVVPMETTTSNALVSCDGSGYDWSDQAKEDHLGKFDGKADEGFFVGYSINSNAFRVFNNRTRIVEENIYHLLTVDPPFSQNSKSSPNAGFKPSGDDEKKVTEEPRKEGSDPSKEVKQKKDVIFISQDKYVAEILKKFRFSEVKTASTPMETQKPLLEDEDG
ncbi:ribonuclease H-like domain-containing protein [Tanacetum coccineum]